MKNLKLVIATLVCMFFVINFSYGQRTQSTYGKPAKTSSSKASYSSSMNQRTSMKKMSNGKQVKFIAAKDLKDGRNYLRMKGTKLEVIKTAGKIKSVRQISNTGQFGSNILKQSNAGTAFWCTGNFCGCDGDADCNDLFESTNCRPSIGDAICVGDACYCIRR